MSRMTIIKIIMLIVGLSVYAAPASAQPVGAGATPAAAEKISDALPKNLNPSAIIEESLTPTKLSGTLQILLLMTVLSLAPAILVMTTCFTRIIVVLALLRQAMATQQLPPSQVVTGLALFMTFCVMTPTWQKINAEAIQPYVNPAPNAKPISGAQAWDAARTHIRRFMINQLENTGNMEDVYLFVEFNSPSPEIVAKLQNNTLQWQDVSLAALIPAFVTSELKQAFIMGFYIYLPFLVIDMVIASLLMSMGMMMLPPVLISLPFKLLLFVLVDGWRLVVGSLMASFTSNGIT
jgi:flagellar biosynthesis protein FliP